MAASAGGTTHARAAAPSSITIDATVAADGSAAAASSGGWEAHKVGVGQYQLEFGHAVEMAVRRWEAPARATVRPVGDASWLVSFDDDDGPVDTAFSFRAAATAP